MKLPFLLGALLPGIFLGALPVLAADLPGPIEIPANKGEVDLMAINPHLKRYLFQEKETEIHFGFGITPLQIMKQSAAVGLSIFQVHLVKPQFDWEIFNVTFGTTISSDPYSKMVSFSFRTFPKWRISENLSAGVIVGYEVVSFPDVKFRLRNTTTSLATFEEPLSVTGLIYGLGASQAMRVGEKEQIIRITEIVYRQNYNVRSKQAGWEYVYLNGDLNNDPTPILPGYVFSIEISFLY